MTQTDNKFARKAETTLSYRERKTKLRATRAAAYLGGLLTGAFIAVVITTYVIYLMPSGGAQ